MEMYAHISRVLVILCLQSWLTSLAFFMPSSPSPAVMTPHLVELEENNQLEVTCEISESHKETHNASQVYFVKHQNYSLGHQYFQIVTQHKARLHVPLATYEHWRGSIICRVDDVPPNFLHLRDLSANVVFRRDPLPPSIKACVVENWESLNCTWTPTLATQRRHTKKKHNPRYKFMWAYASDHHTHYCCQDPRASQCPENATEHLNDTCIMTADSRVNPFRMGELYHLTLRAETDKDFVVDKWGNGTAFNTSLHVKPNPPENVKVTFYNHTNQLLTWERPNTRWEEANTWLLRYSVSVTSKHSKMTYSVVSADSQLSTLIPVHAYTTYSVWISVIPDHGGYQSDDAFLQFTIPATAPSINPELFTAGYTYEICTGATCKVNIYWKPLKEELLNGPDFDYVIKTQTVSPGTMAESLMYDPTTWTIKDLVPNSRQSSATINITNGQSMEVIIQAQNDVGIYPVVEDSRIRIEAKETLLQAHEHLVIEAASDRPNEVLLWLDPSHGIDESATYNVFWKNRNALAPDPIGWSELPHRDELTLTLPDRHYLYRFGFTKTIGTKNSGIIWGDTISTDDVNILPPVDFEVEESTVNSLCLSWLSATYKHSTQRPHIREYKLTFCVKDIKTGQCREPVRRMTQVVPGSHTHVELLNLTPNTEYVISIVSVTRTKNSEEVYVQGLAKTQSGYSAMAIAGMVAGSIVGIIVLIIGMYTCCKKCWDCTKPQKGIVIRIPDDTKLAARQCSTSSEMPMLRSFSGSSYSSGYKRQISAVSSEMSSDGELCNGEHTDDPCFDNNNTGLLRVSSSSKNLKCIPESHDDVFESDSDKEEEKFVKAYKLLPEQKKEHVSLKQELLPQVDDQDPLEGGICKYAIIGLSQNKQDSDDDDFVVQVGNGEADYERDSGNFSDLPPPVSGESGMLKEIVIPGRDHPTESPASTGIEDTSSQLIYPVKPSQYVPNSYPFSFSGVTPYVHKDCVKVNATTPGYGRELVKEPTQ